MGAGTVLLARLAMNHHFINVFAMALGISTADTVMAILASLGLKVLEYYLPLDNPALYGLMGIILLVFAVYLWKTPPSSLKNAHRMSHATYFLTGFSLTTLNPMVLPGFVALFAALDLSFNVPPLVHAYAMVALFLGCALWWYGLTVMIFFLTKSRGEKSLNAINKGLAGIMVVLSISILIRGASDLF